TVTGSMMMNGIAGNTIKLRSNSPGTNWYLVNTGTSTLSFVDAQDSNANGGRFIKDFPGGVDSGRNSNWIFTDSNRYWVSPSLALWNSTFTWSYASGGASGAPPPTSTTTVIFDGANGSNGISSVTAAISISTLTMTAGYAGSLNLQGWA